VSPGLRRIFKLMTYEQVLRSKRRGQRLERTGSEFSPRTPGRRPRTGERSRKGVTPGGEMMPPVGPAVPK
jgi:hypothetical protein